jgi:chemotaxis signal transduction protein
MERLKILIFKVGSRHFAFVSKDVREILDSHGNLKKVFYGGRALKGLMNFEGDVVSVLDAPSILDAEGDGEEPLILLCKEKGMDKGVGITASEMEGMKVIDLSSITSPEEKDAPYIWGLLREEGERVVTLLNLKRLLDYAETKVESL